MQGGGVVSRVERGKGMKSGGGDYLVCVDAVVHKRPADSACIERKSDAPVDCTCDCRPTEKGTPVEC